MTDYDAIIIGSGAGGLSAARAARPGRAESAGLRAARNPRRLDALLHPAGLQVQPRRALHRRYPAGRVDA